MILLENYYQILSATIQYLWIASSPIMIPELLVTIQATKAYTPKSTSD